MYKKWIITNQYGVTTEHILLFGENGLLISFSNSESNDGPERKTYLAWVAEGNVAEEWNQ